MKLFSWSSEHLRNWAPGYIVVMAKDVDEARVLASKEVNKQIFERYFWHYGSMEDLDEEQLEEFYSYLMTFKDDIAKEPEEIEAHVMFISGSE